jgi:hypothetical protein
MCVLHIIQGRIRSFTAVSLVHRNEQIMFMLPVGSHQSVLCVLTDGNGGRQLIRYRLVELFLRFDQSQSYYRLSNFSSTTFNLLDL